MFDLTWLSFVIAAFLGINYLLFFFSRNVLVKGGHLPDSLDAIDVFFDGRVRLYFMSLLSFKM